MLRKKGRYVYDEESYPNFFSAVFKNTSSREYKRFIVFADSEDDKRSINQVAELVDFVEKEVQYLVGFNNMEYDDVLLKNIMTYASRLRLSHPKIATKETNELSREIIGRKNKSYRPPRMNTLMKVKPKWKSIDLIQLLNPGDRIGLKRLAISLRWPKIQDLPFKYDHIIKYDEIPVLMPYNDNDVDMTELVMNEMSEAINQRIGYQGQYKTDILNSCNSAVGRTIMADIYSKHMGLRFEEFEKQATNYKELWLKDCISPKIHFKGREFNRVLKKTIETKIDPNRDDKSRENEINANGGKPKKKSQFEVTVRTKYLTHTMQLGGLHSNGPAEVMQSNEYYVYIDLDVAGYYPRIICNEKLFPAHLDPIFPILFQEHVVDRRGAIKKSNPVLAYMLKIAANATFGLTDVKGKADSWLKDPKVAKHITISGQLFLLMLMEGLETYSNCLVVYSNTDGLTVRVPRNQISLFYNICDRWQKYTNFELEFKNYDRIIIRDVNNYLIFVDTDNPEERIKAKGVYQFENMLSKELKVKGFVYPIIPMAVREWYDKGTPVEDTIMNCRSIYDFMKAQNTDRDKYDVIFYPRDMRIPDQNMQTNNRWIVTDGNPLEGRMIKKYIPDVSKKKKTKVRASNIEMQKGYVLTITNDVDETLPIESYHLNYSFYINQAKDIINLTKALDKETHLPEYVQPSLFD